MRPAQFWRLTEYEVGAMLEAAHEREEGERRFRAAMTANLMNCWRSSKSPAITVDALLGTGKPEAKRGAWLSKSIQDMTRLQRNRLQNHLVEEKARREAAKH